MDSYVIRIYRRELDKPENLLGVVEMTSDGTQRSFRSRDELWDLLAEATLCDKKYGNEPGKTSA